MGDQFWATISGTIALIVGLAVIAVVLSPKATTSTVINTSTTGLASLINAATSPVTGNGSGGFSSFTPSLTLPTYG